MPSIRTGLIAAFVLGWAVAAVAEVPEDIPRLRQFTQGNQPLLRFSIADGRVILGCRGQTNLRSENNAGKARKELLSVASDRGQATLTYERTNAREELKISVAGSNRKMSISRLPVGKSSVVPMEFQQESDEAVTLTLGVGDHRQVFRAADFWRLAISYPKECREQLIPLLDMLRTDWKLAEVVKRVESGLLANAGTDAAAMNARWGKLVEQLGNDQFAKREAADRELRTGGVSALTYLRRLNLDQLDAEQQFRIHRILVAIGGRSDEDSVDNVAAILAHDPLVWLALLSRSEAATRQTAARQLVKLLGHPIDVDPAAQPDTQKAKREILRAQIEKK
jgi:hypothetical protein